MYVGVVGRFEKVSCISLSLTVILRENVPHLNCQSDSPLNSEDITINFMIEIRVCDEYLEGGAATLLVHTLTSSILNYTYDGKS